MHHPRLHNLLHHIPLCQVLLICQVDNFALASLSEDIAKAMYDIIGKRPMLPCKEEPPLACIGLLQLVSRWNNLLTLSLYLLPSTLTVSLSPMLGTKPLVMRQLPSTKLFLSQLTLSLLFIKKTGFFRILQSMPLEQRKKASYIPCSLMNLCMPMSLAVLASDTKWLPSENALLLSQPPTTLCSNMLRNTFGRTLLIGSCLSLSCH